MKYKSRRRSGLSRVAVGKVSLTAGHLEKSDLAKYHRGSLKYNIKMMY